MAYYLVLRSIEDIGQNVSLQAGEYIETVSDQEDLDWITRMGNALSLVQSVPQGYTAIPIDVSSTSLYPTASNKLDQIDTNTETVAVTSSGRKTSVTITRPSNTTAYTAGDVVGDTNGSAILTFSNIGPSTGGEILITSVELEIDVSSVPSGMSSFNLRLYNASPTAIADNAAWDLISGDRSKYLGKISLATPIDEGSTLFSDNDGINKQISLTTGSLYVILQTVGAFTPSSAAVKKLTIHTIAV